MEKNNVEAAESAPPKEYLYTRCANKRAQQAKKDAKKTKVKNIASNFWKRLRTFPDRLANAIVLGAVTAIVLNVIAKFFWPELPEKIPTIYEFFDGFMAVGEFFFKTAIGGIASIFNGTFLEFCDSITAEMHEMWKAFCSWVLSIKF